MTAQTFLTQSVPLALQGRIIGRQPRLSVPDRRAETLDLEMSRGIGRVARAVPEPRQLTAITFEPGQLALKRGATRSNPAHSGSLRLSHARATAS
jgi:hypothetical protein